MFKPTPLAHKRKEFVMDIKEMSLLDMMREFYNCYDSGGRARELCPAITSHPEFTVEKWILFFCNPEEEKYNNEYESWHLFWIFARLKLEDQMGLLEASVNTPLEKRTLFDTHLLGCTRVLSYLAFPLSPGGNTPLATIVELLRYGITYQSEVCGPSRGERNESLLSTVRLLKFLIAHQEVLG